MAEDGSVCLAGALRVARWGSDEFQKHQLPHGLRPFIAAAIDPDFKPGWIRNWNDQPERTFSEVIDVLDRAEKIAEAAS